MKVVITGANGFIGKKLCEQILGIPNVELLKLSRKPNKVEGLVKSPNLDSSSDWSETLLGADVVVHTAGRAHILTDVAENSLNDFLKVNFYGTVNLAKQALSAGVSKFIYFSSIGVNGALAGKEIIGHETRLCPVVDYAVSKAKAEVAIQKIFRNTTVDLVIIRPPLVYSGFAPGNFETLLKATYRRLPLPLGAINNQRHLLSVYNLADFVSVCIKFSSPCSGVYVVSDDEIISIPDILKQLTSGMMLESRVFKIPHYVLNLLAMCVGKSNSLEKICGDFLVDNSNAKNVFNWEPPYTTSDALILAGQEYLTKRKVEIN
nr:NAD-dependent epimerase/dehydratase family protein [uncultured Glaciecola sp.]